MTRRIEAAAALALALTACSGGMTVSVPTLPGSDAGQLPAATVVSLSISPAAPTVPQGAQEQLVATAHLSDGTSADVSAQAAWSTSAAAVSALSASADGL